MSPTLAASFIADTIEDGDTPLGVRIGEDATMILDARKQAGDAEVEAAMRPVLSLDW